ncbi:MAG: methionyl-tRNA formyltransferase [Calditrichia bacterium]|nr:methionyl-tRNA formyltransferase [Calditrichia bacterium]
MGTPQFAVVSLKKLLEEKINIIAVVTAPDKQKGRGLKILPSPVKSEAEKYNIPVLQPEKLKDPVFQHQLQQLNPDLIVVVAFRILPELIFAMPPLGTINLHGSLLPKYRGAAPINWAIINGETETGVTTIFINKQVDTGNIISNAKVKISENMTAGELHDEMAIVGAGLLFDTCLAISENTVQTKMQDESLASLAPKIFKENCKIDFNHQAKNLHNFIRGLSPYPTAYAFMNGKMVKLFESSIFEEHNNRNESPGAIVDIIENNLIVQCAQSSISVNEIQIEGKRKMKTEEYLRGSRIEIGAQFE